MLMTLLRQTTRSEYITLPPYPLVPCSGEEPCPIHSLVLLLLIVRLSQALADVLAHFDLYLFIKTVALIVVAILASERRIIPLGTRTLRTVARWWRQRAVIDVLLIVTGRRRCVRRTLLPAAGTFLPAASTATTGCLGCLAFGGLAVVTFGSFAVVAVVVCLLRRGIGRLALR